MASGEDRATRLRALIARPILALTVLVAGVSLAVVARDWLDPGDVSAEPTTTTLPPTTTTTAPRPMVPVSTTLASPHGEVPVFDGPDGAQTGTAGYWYGYPMTMPVLAQRDGFAQIRMPERPNGSTAWVRLTDVDLSTTEYRIVVRRNMTDVTIYRAGFPLVTFPAGLGKASTPTPLGSFFVAVIEKPGPHGYGPIVLDTSGHSEAIQSWQGAGDAIIALHGPISSSSDARIGSTGTYISNGCIRLHTADQLKLDQIPLGTPVDVVEV